MVETHDHEALSKRERQIAAAYAEGMAYKEIAEHFGIAPATVRTHLRTIYRKLGVSTKVALLRALETDPPASSEGADDDRPEDARLEAFLSDYGLQAHSDALRRNDVDLDLLPDLSDGDLKEIGIHSLGARRRLLAAARLVDDQNEPPQSHAPEDQSSDPSISKRQVSLLVVDFAKAVSAFGVADDGSLNAHLGVCLEKATEIVEASGGMVEAVFGQTIAAVFGAGRASGYPSQQSTTAAKSIVDTFQSDAAELLPGIGVATGTVMRRSRQRDDTVAQLPIAGRTLDLARAMAEAANPGEILVTGGIRRSLSDWLETGAARSVSTSHPGLVLEAWPLTSVSVTPRTARFVGRHAELSILRTVFKALGTTSSGRTICIGGEAGIGKTSLVQSVVTMLPSHIRCMTALVLDFGQGSGSEVEHVIASWLVSLLTSEAPKDLSARISDMIRQGRIPEAHSLHIHRLCGLEVPGELAALAEALSASAAERGTASALEFLLRTAAAEAPLVIVVEDLHWAQQTTRETIAQLAALSSQLPLVLVITTRPSDASIESDLRDRFGVSGILTIDLQGLEVAEALELADYLLPGVEARTSFADCIERAQGNPLFLRQLLAHVESDGADVVPESIQAIVQSRMDQLSGPARELLQASAILGQRFSPDAARFLVGDPDAEFSPLLKANFFQVMQGDFLFSHALIRDSIYSFVLIEDAKALHLRASEWFKGRDLTLCAAHLEAALDPGAALAYLKAAEEFAGTSRLSDAWSAMESGLRLAQDNDVYVRLMILRARLFFDMDKAEEAKQAFQQALDRTTTEAERCDALLGLVSVMRVTDEIDAAFDLLDEVEALGRDSDLPEVLAQAKYFQGCLYFPRGEIDKCLVAHEAAISYSERSGRMEQKCQALSGLGDAYYAQGRMLTAHRYISECLDVAAENRFGKIEAANLFMRATVRIYLNETKPALEDALRSVSIAERTYSTRAEIVSRLTATWILISLDDVAQARQQVEAGLAAAERAGAPRFIPFLQESLARVQNAEGDRIGALATISAARDATRTEGQQFIRPWILGTLARLSRNRRERVAALAEAEALLARGCVGHNYFRLHQAGIEVGIDLGDPAIIKRHCVALSTFTAKEQVPWSEMVMKKGLLFQAILEGGLQGDREQLELFAVSKDMESAGLIAMSRRTGEQARNLGVLSA